MTLYRFIFPFLGALAMPQALAHALPAPSPTPAVITIDPEVSWGKWEGWGTSLCWDGKAFGDRDDLADLLFTTKTVPILGHDLPGLGLNIARYNAGACSWNELDGRKMAVSKIIQPFRQMEGFWLDGKSDDPQSGSWDWKADANQRALLLKARDRGADHLELFSNSPMWWMCRNDNPSGSRDGKEDNLAPEYREKFATYLATIARQAKDQWGVTFTSVEPFNEPSAVCWFADCKQEGCHFSHEDMAAVLPLLRKKLDDRGLTGLPMSASDDGNDDQAVGTWQSFTADTKALVNKVNVHGYQYVNGDRALLHDLVSKDGKEFWNSEYGDNDGTGLKLAQCLQLDFSRLHPTAWCYWQPFDNKGWGLVETDMPTKTFQSINPKYFIVAQYTRHIRPGMVLLETGDPDTVAAYGVDDHKLVLVIRAHEAGTKTFDLGKFSTADGPVTRWITEPKGVSRYERRQDNLLKGKLLTLHLPPDSVQTLEIEHVIAP